MRAAIPRLRRIAAWLLAALLGAGVAMAEDAPRHALPHQGIERHYTLYRPPGAGGGALPLVVALHGLTQPVESLRAWLPLDPVAEREGFAVAYPEALDGRWRYEPGGAVVPGTGELVDDVGFIARLLDRLVAEGGADPTRIYLAGVSRGAVMAWLLACRLPDRLAAVAPLSSGMREVHLDACTPGRAVPVVAVAGTADPVQAYDGWLDGPPLGRLLSIPETMEFWRRRHGCTGQTARQLPHRRPDDPTRTQHLEWTGCMAGPVMLFRVVGGGHQPPSFTPNSDAQRARFGRRGGDIETAEEIWRVFRAVPPLPSR